MPAAYYIGRAFYRLAFRTYFRWHVIDAANVPAEGPLILASSHASFLDPPLVGCGVDRMCHFLARATLFKNPIASRMLHAVCAVPVDRDGGSAAGLKTILTKLKEGCAIVLFPEGTRTLDGQLQKARSGIGMMALKSGAPVVPVRILGTFEAFGKHRTFPHPHRVTVRYGQPLRFEKERAEAETCPRDRLREIYQEMADRIMAEIAALGPERPA